jgi:hypothetical protein
MIGSRTTTKTIPAKVTAAINQLSANQAAIMQLMAAMSFSLQPSIAVQAFNVPPIQNATIPMQQAFTGGVFNPGTGNMYIVWCNGRCCWGMGGRAMDNALTGIDIRGG